MCGFAKVFGLVYGMTDILENGQRLYESDLDIEIGVSCVALDEASSAERFTKRYYSTMRRRRIKVNQAYTCFHVY